MRNFYFVMRHGESTANHKNLIVCDEKNALNDYGLTSRGTEQVTTAAVKTRLDKDVLIMSSDYLRARQSAQIMQKIICTKTPIEYHSELRERSFGEFNLLDDSNYDRVWQNDSQNPDSCAHGVESVAQVLSRALCLIDELEFRHKNRTILLVGHGDVLQIMAAYFSGLPCHLHRLLLAIKNAEIRKLAEPTKNNNQTTSAPLRTYSNRPVS